MKTKLSLALLTAMALPGCYLDLGGPGSFDESIEPPPPTSTWEGTNELDVDTAQLEGRLGGFSANANAWVASTYGDQYFASIDIRARGARGVIMNSLAISGNIQELEAGTVYEPGAPAGLTFSMIGCAGPEDNLWDYDRSTDDVEVSVEEGPEAGTVELFYTATFEDGSASRGSFVMPN